MGYRLHRPEHDMPTRIAQHGDVPQLTQAGAGQYTVGRGRFGQLVRACLFESFEAAGFALTHSQWWNFGRCSELHFASEPRQHPGLIDGEPYGLEAKDGR